MHPALMKVMVDHRLAELERTAARATLGARLVRASGAAGRVESPPSMGANPRFRRFQPLRYLRTGVR